MSATDSAAAVLRKLRVRRVTVEPQFPIGLGRALERKGIGVVVARGTMTPERQVKAPGEVSNIRESQRAAVLAMRAAIDMIAGSRADAKGVLRIAGAVLTCESVKERIEQVLLGERCSATQTIVACGEQAVNPHEAGHGAIRAHEAIVVDIFPRHREHGYWGDLTRTVVKGKASRKLRSIYEAVRRAQEAGLRKIRAGVSGSAVHRAVDVELARRGFETGMQDGKRYGFIHSTGHGVGLEVHEAPSLAPGGRRLRAGNVVTVEPGLYYPGIGAVRIEDTVVVTSAGCCLLARCEHRFEL